MAGCRVQMVLGLLLLLLMWTVEPAATTGDVPDGCYTSRIHNSTSLREGLYYLCGITPDNRELVLKKIKQPHILNLILIISDHFSHFVFNESSFSQDLRNLSVTSYLPFHISSGAFNRSTSITVLHLEQYYDIDIQAAKLIPNLIVGGDTNLTFPTFGEGWLTPLTGLRSLTLRKSNISCFRVEEFCVLQQLQNLDISHNRINTIHKLGITRNNINMSHTSCLPNLTYLNISYNAVHSFEVRFEENLPHLKDLDLSNCHLSFVNLNFVLTRAMKTLFLNGNELVSLFKDETCNKSTLMSLSLQNNRLQDMSPGLFTCVPELRFMSLSNNRLTQDTLVKSGLNNLTQLQWLDLSFNPLRTLNAALIGNLTELLKFHCISCSVTGIRNDTFIHLDKLKILKLSKNNLHLIDRGALSHLNSLQILDLSENYLKSTAFISSLPPIQELYMGHNNLHQIPQFSRSWGTLSVLILERNNIPEIKPHQLSNLTNLRRLSLAFNFITNVPDDSLILYSLKNLYLNNNNLKTIGDFALDGLQQLTYLRLDNNYLTEYPAIFDRNSLRLKGLNLSRNIITTVKKVRHQAEWIDLSYNKLTKFNVPIMYNIKLKILNLSHNKLKTFNYQNFFTFTTPRPKVYLQGNPLLCDCEMEWLLDTKMNKPIEDIFKERFNTKKKLNSKLFTLELKKGTKAKAFYPEVPGLDLLQCTDRVTGRSTLLSEKKRGKFVCRYINDCDTPSCTENCCHLHSCSCRAFCYPQCKCYSSFHPTGDSFVNCTSRNMTTLPLKGPRLAHKIYLDGNNLTDVKLSNLSFPHLQILYLNNSHIAEIEEGAFRYIPILKLLDLHQNQISAIRTETFEWVNLLEELYLQENQIQFMEDDSFSSLPHLKTLRLHDNYLEYLNVSIFPNSLTDVTLHDNPWVCDCQFGPVFKEWIVTHSNIIMNHTQIYCKMNIDSYSGLHIYTTLDGYSQNDVKAKETSISQVVVFADFSHCGNKTILMTIHHRNIKSTTEIISLVSAFMLFIMIVLVIYKYRLLIRVWAYNRFGVQLNHKDNEDDENDDKPYDIFIAYPNDDNERQLIRDMLQRLEALHYRVCLEARDWDPRGGTAETIIASIQKSKRTIILVSENYFDTRWCEYTFDAAHYQVLNDKQLRLILVLNDKALQARMDRSMNLYMKTNASLVWGERWFWEKLRYYLAANPRGTDEETGREFQLLQAYRPRREVDDEHL